jgi:hypothetical protein
VADLEEMVEEDLEDAGGSFFLFAALEPMEGDLSPDDDIYICYDGDDGDDDDIYICYDGDDGDDDDINICYDGDDE